MINIKKILTAFLAISLLTSLLTFPCMFASPVSNEINSNISADESVDTGGNGTFDPNATINNIKDSKVTVEFNNEEIERLKNNINTEATTNIKSVSGTIYRYVMLLSAVVPLLILVIVLIIFFVTLSRAGEHKKEWFKRNYLKYLIIVLIIFAIWIFVPIGMMIWIKSVVVRGF